MQLQRDPRVLLKVGEQIARSAGLLIGDSADRAGKARRRLYQVAGD